MKIIGVIPARYESKRFPGKALARLWGKPILQHVYEQSAKSSVLDTVIIATDDSRIQDIARGFGAPVVMTSKDCSSGSDRVGGAVVDLDCEIVVDIQADQPVLPPQILEEVVKPLLIQSELQITTPVYSITDLESLNNPNVVKVVIDKKGFALYFSRSFIPYKKSNIQNVQPYYKHIGIYAYRKEFLLKYAQLPPSPLERTEGLEQLRVLENGYRIKTVLATCDSPSIDTKEDLELMKKQKAKGQRLMAKG